MRKSFVIKIIFGLILIFGLPQVIYAMDINYAEDEIIVKFKTEQINLYKNPAQVETFANEKILALKENLPSANASVFKIKSRETVYQAIKRIEKDSRVEYAQPNFRYELLSINTNDTYKDYLWGLDNFGQSINQTTGTSDADIDAPEAWAINEGTNQDVIVAVVDTGVGYNHPDLLSNMWDGTNCLDENGNYLGGCIHGYDFGFNDKNPLPNTDSHGTHVAGTIAALKNNGQGIIGVAPQAKIMAIQTTLADGYFYDAEIVKAINFANVNGAKVINASWGGSGLAAIFWDQLTYDAIENFPGLFIAAAGNAATEHDGLDYIVVPADFGHPISGFWDGLDNIISVAATNSLDELAPFSDYGVNFVDVGAPGVDTYSSVSEQFFFYQTFANTTTGTIPDGWTTSGGNWGAASVLPFNPLSSWGQVFYADINGANETAPYYAANANNTITSPVYDLSTVPIEATFNFRARCDTEYGDYAGYEESFTDYMTLEFTTDGIAFAEPNLYWSQGKFNEYILDQLDFDDDSDNDAWHYFDDISLDGFLNDNFQFRFSWTTDNDDNNHRGCIVDNINVYVFTDGSGNAYDFYSGTSMAAPHVSGLAALITGYSPSLTVAQVKSIILTSGDSLPSLNGKTVTGKRINAYNALRQANVPAIPTLNSVTTPTSVATQTISGTKEMNTSIWLNGAQIVELDSSTTWSYNLALVEGDNNISLTSKNNVGLESQPASATIFLDSIPPIINTNTTTGIYKKPQTVILNCDEANCSIYYTLNGEEPTNNSNQYNFPLELKSSLVLKAVTYDQVGNKSDTLIIVIDLPSRVLILTPASAGGSQIRVAEKDGMIISSFFAYSKNLRGGYETVLADIDGDHNDEIIVAPNSGFGPDIRAYEIDGTFIARIMTYQPSFRGGVNITAADLDGDGQEEIITAPESAGGPNIRAYKLTDGQFKLLDWFMAYQSNFTGGVNLTSGDVDGDSQKEIITAPADSGGPNIRAYKFINGSFNLLDWFMAYQEEFTGGVNLITSDLDGDLKAELITAPQKNGGPNIRIYKFTTNKFQLLDGSMVYPEDFRGGLNLTSGDLDNDNKEELVVAAKQDNSQIKTYDFIDNRLVLGDWLDPYGEKFTKGINLIANDIDGDSYAEVMTAPASGHPNIRVYDFDNQVISLHSWFWGFQKNFEGGVNLGK